MTVGLSSLDKPELREYCPRNCRLSIPLSILHWSMLQSMSPDRNAGPVDVLLVDPTA
jgi:hypothetical protein